MKKKLVLYSETFKGYLRIEEKKIGGELQSMTLLFHPKEEATTFPDQKDVDDFIKSYCGGVNYNFRIETTDLPKVSVSVPPTLTDDELKQCANIHYIEIVKIDRTKSKLYTLVTVEYRETCVDQLVHFGFNVGKRLLQNEAEKEFKKKRPH